MIGNRVGAGVVGVLLLATAGGWAAPRPVEAATSPTVSVRLAYPSVYSGQAEHIDGQVSPPVPAGPVREVVTLQQFSVNAWHDVKAAALDQSSAYDVAVKPPVEHDRHLYLPGRVEQRDEPYRDVHGQSDHLHRALAPLGRGRLPGAREGMDVASPPGQLLTLQRLNRKTGVSYEIRSGRTDAFGRYDITVRSDVAGIYTYRIVWQSTASVHTVTVPVSGGTSSPISRRCSHPRRTRPAPFRSGARACRTRSGGSRTRHFRAHRRSTD